MLRHALHPLASSLGPNGMLKLIRRPDGPGWRATAAGAAPDTIYGLSGAGDLALTCAGPHSRNMAYGLALGRGEAMSFLNDLAARPPAGVAVLNCVGT